MNIVDLDCVYVCPLLCFISRFVSPAPSPTHVEPAHLSINIRPTDVDECPKTGGKSDLPVIVLSLRELQCQDFDFEGNMRLDISGTNKQS